MTMYRYFPWLAAGGAMGYAARRGLRVEREVESPNYTERWTRGWSKEGTSWGTLGIQATYMPLKEALSEMEEDTTVQPYAPLPFPPGLSGKNRTLVIHALFVSPKRRGRGWGRRFVAALEREAQRERAKAILVFASPLNVHQLMATYDTPEALPVAFWRRMGFKPLAEWQQPLPGNELSRTGDIHLEMRGFPMPYDPKPTYPLAVMYKLVAP